MLRESIVSPEMLKLLYQIEYRLLMKAGRLKITPRSKFLVDKLRFWLRRKTRSDWRTMVGDSGLPGRRWLAIQEMLENGCSVTSEQLIKSWNEEEWITACLINRNLDEKRFITPVFPQEQTIWVTAHYDASIVGAFLLGKNKRVINAVGSNVVEHHGLPNSVKSYYREKYRALEAQFNGGKVLYLENGLRSIFDGLKRGNDLIIIADIPAKNSGDAAWVPLFGKTRGFAPGAVFLARKFGIDLQSYVIDSRGDELQLTLGPRMHINGPEDHLPVYRYLMDCIENNPGKWWAADLLAALPIADAVIEGAT